jgi:xylan 1,4-beta-xylosidase
MPAWRAMGSPQYITLDQIKELRQRAAIPPATALRLNESRQVAIDLPPEGIALIELSELS